MLWRKRLMRWRAHRNSVTLGGLTRFARNRVAYWPTDEQLAAAGVDVHSTLVSTTNTEVVIRLRFRPFRIEPEVLLEHGASLPIELAGRAMLGLFDRGAPRTLEDVLDLDPVASHTFSVTELLGTAESDTLFLVFREEGGLDAGRAFVDDAAHEIEKFRQLFEQWADVATQQDPAPFTATSGRRIDARVRTGSHVVGHDSNPDVEPTMTLMTISSARPLDMDGVSEVVELSLAGVAVPTAWQMLRLAHRSRWFRDYRIGVTEAGVAAELSLAHLLTSLAGVSVDNVRRWTLGTLCHKMDEHSLTFPGGHDLETVMQRVVTVRNDAVHRGLADAMSATGMIDIVEEFVEAAYPLGTHLSGWTEEG